MAAGIAVSTTSTNTRSAARIDRRGQSDPRVGAVARTGRNRRIEAPGSRAPPPGNALFQFLADQGQRGRIRLGAAQGGLHAGPCS